MHFSRIETVLAIVYFEGGCANNDWKNRFSLAKNNFFFIYFLQRLFKILLIIKWVPIMLY